MLLKKTPPPYCLLGFIFLLLHYSVFAQNCLVINPFAIANTDGFTTTDVAQSFTMDCTDGVISSISVWSFSNNTEIDLYIYQGNGFDDPMPYTQADVILIAGAPTNNEIALKTPLPFVSGQTYTFRLVLSGGGTFQLAKNNLVNTYSGGNLFENGTPQFSEDLFFTINTTGALLPVELSKFEVKPERTSVMLYWETAMELNNSGFEIERSTNARDWESIGFVEGQGSQTAISSYEFEDTAPKMGWNYYRLKQIDFDGAFEYSDIRSLELTPLGLSQTAFKLFPNPAYSGQSVQIELATPERQGRNIQVFNTWGSLVLSVPLTIGETHQQILLSNLSAGSYTLVLKDTKEHLASRQQLIIID